jgi:hypothetical protein
MSHAWVSTITMIGAIWVSGSGTALDQRSFPEHMSTRFEDDTCGTTTMTN